MSHSSADIQKSIKKYLMVGAILFLGTVITVAANQVHLAVPLAITVALIIATVKGSFVAAVFMHLSAEKKWIYAALALTVIGFLDSDDRADVHPSRHDRHADPCRGTGAWWWTLTCR